MGKSKIMFLALIILFFSSCNLFTKNEPPLIKGKWESLLVIEIPKAGCNNCKRVVENGLLDIKGIKQSQLNVKKKELSVLYDPLKTSEENIKQLVANLKDDIPCK
jgi:periplasmic mercuric ion binding protein